MCATGVLVDLPVSASQVSSDGPKGIRRGVIGGVRKKKINVFQGWAKALELSIDQATIAALQRIIRSEEEKAFTAGQGLGELGGIDLNTL